MNNHSLLASPWRRKAESMAKAWKVILRYGQSLHPRRPPRRFRDWSTAVAGMLKMLQQRGFQQRARTGWRRWASDRALEARRWPGKFQAK